MTETKNEIEGHRILDVKAVEDLDLSPCDIFLVLPSGKRLLLCENGKEINSELIEKYSKNEEVKIIVLEEDYPKILNSRIQKKINIMKQKLSDKQWMNRIARYDNELNSVAMVRVMINLIGINETTLDLIDQTIDSTLYTFEKIPSLKTILSDICGRGDYFLQKALIINYLAVYVLSKGPWNNDSTRSKLSMAAFLHDFKTNDRKLIETKLNADSSADMRVNYEKFVSHAHLEYEYLKTVADVPDDVTKLVRLHHVDLDGSGYPMNEVSQLGPLSQIFNISHNFAVEIIKNGYSKKSYSGYYYDLSNRILEKYKDSLDPFSYLL